MIQLGNHMWEKCADCGKLVKLTGWLRGIHFCLTPEEIAAKREIQKQPGSGDVTDEEIREWLLPENRWKGRAAD
jgi:hypothetical protein